MPEPVLSLIIPTRERASYLASCLRTCTANGFEAFEILVLDNASRDDTAQVVQAVTDSRVRYLRSDRRLSMRDNFEKGIDESRGRYLGFIGDDDGVFPFTAQKVVELFETLKVEAVSAARAHYSWPDLLMARAGTGLLPRGSGIERRRSRVRLRRVLEDNNYYTVPCVYHGFVSRAAIERARKPQGRFFVSSIVDCASAVALGMLDLEYVFSGSPLIINGGSSRSNGASQFGGGSTEEQENWKVEDDLGFLPGFDNTETVEALIVETAARSVAANPGRALEDIFDLAEVHQALLREVQARRLKKRDLDEAFRMFDSVGLPEPAPGEMPAPASRFARNYRRLQLFLDQMPIDLLKMGVRTVDGAAGVMTSAIEDRTTGLFRDLPAQIQTARRIAGG